MHSFLFVFLLLFLLIYIYIYIYIYTLFTYLQNLLSPWVICGSAEQPLQVPGGRALSQPMPHPSGKLCEGIM